MRAAVALVALLSLSSGCAHGLDGARQTLSNTERVEEAAIHALEDYDRDTQQAIVDEARKTGDAEAARKKLEDYRHKRAELVKIINDATAVTAVGGPLIELVARGQKKDTDVAAWLADVLTAMSHLRDALHAFGVKLPGGI